MRRLSIALTFISTDITTQNFTITKRLKRRLSREDFEKIKGNVKHFNIPITIDNFGLYYCKDVKHRYYREISKYKFKG